MPNFDSPIGVRSFQGQPMKELDVPDESGYSTENVTNNKLGGNQRVAVPMNEDSIREFQARMAAQAQVQMNSNDFHSDAELEREIRAAREAKRTGKERLNDGAKRRVEMLIGMTRLTRLVAVGDNTFLLRTLNGKETREAMMATSQFDGTIQFPYEMRKQLLARSLVQISNVDFEQFIGSNLLEHKFLFIDELEEPLLLRLHSEYVTLDQEAKSKYSIRTEEEAKEVVEDLKK